MEGFNALYFSFITLSTVGFGDIVPVSSMARMLAITEAVFGMFYVTLMIARLVSLYAVRGSSDAVNPGRKAARQTGIRRLRMIASS
jgi:Ion channel